MPPFLVLPHLIESRAREFNDTVHAPLCKHTPPPPARLDGEKLIIKNVLEFSIAHKNKAFDQGGFLIK